MRLSRAVGSRIKEVKYSMATLLAVNEGTSSEKFYNMEKELQGNWTR